MIQQGYLSITEDSEVRLRKEGDRRRLTIKKGHGEKREETEVELPAQVFDELWPKTEGQRVEKTRHPVALDGGFTAEVDVYSGNLQGLVTAEVEFDSESASGQFEAPGWMGTEVTGDSQYANQSLAAKGLPGGIGWQGDRGTRAAE